MLLALAGVAYLTRLDITTTSRWIREFERAGNASTVPGGQQRDRLVYALAKNYELANQYSELLVVCCIAYYLFILTRQCLAESPLLRFGAAKTIPSLDNNFRSRPVAARLAGGPTKILAQAPELIIFTATCCLVVLCIPLRLVFGWREAEDFLATIIMFLMPLKLLFFCRGSKSLGSFIVMIYKILVNDVLCFVVFLVIFIAGFSQCE
jgi:hypothetical protein